MDYRQLAKDWLEAFEFPDIDGEFYLTPEDREFLCAAIRVWISADRGESFTPNVEVDGIKYVPFCSERSSDDTEDAESEEEEREEQ